MSILDYEQKELCPSVWKNNELREGVKNFIINQVKLFFSSLDIEDVSFINNILIGSSLATFYFTETSDFDVKIIIDLEKFHDIAKNFDYLDDNTMLDKLIDIGRQSSFLTAPVPQTEHNLDIYFYSNINLPEQHLIKYDSLYSLKSDSWIKYPKKLNFKHSDIILYAKEKSQQYINSLDLKFGETYRDSVELLSLIDYFKTADSDDLDEIKSEFIKLYKELKEDLGELSDLREDIKKDRIDAFSKKELETELEKASKSLNFSDGNIKFKYIQKIGYLSILSELNKVCEKKNLKFKDIRHINKVLQ